MGLIEQAAKRLEELQRAGAEVPQSPAARAPENPEPARPASSPPAALPAASMPHPAAPLHVAPPSQAQAAHPQAHAPVDLRSRPRAVRPRAHIDLDRLQAMGFVTPREPRSRIAEEFRVLKRPLIANATAGKPTSVARGNLIMVTSSIPSEGKTFCAVNLAISIAMEVDRQILLVDADVARPSVPGTLGIKPARGLMDVLTGDCRDVGDLIVRTDIDKLSFLPSGTMHEGASELLASEGMNRLVDELGQRYADRIVLFDSPPLLAATEPSVLATHMGQIVFVIHAEKTLQSNVERALAAIESCPVKLLILNAAKLPAQGTYGYGYGYGYGQGYGARE